MRILITGLIFIVSTLFLFGHNPLSARYHLKAGEQGSSLTINLSQDGVNHLYSKIYEKEKLEKISQKEFKEWIVDYIKNNFNLSIDEQKVALKKGGIKLGSHQTDLKFVLPPITKKVEKMKVHIPAFSENDNHQTIFSYDIKGQTDHKVLSAYNDYRFTILCGVVSSTNSWIWTILVGLVGLVGLVSFVRLKMKHLNLRYAKL